MKRLSLLLFVVFAAVVLAPLDVVVLGDHAYMVPAEVDAAPLGPGNTAVPATNSGTGTTNAAASTDILVSGKPVCVAVPIKPGPQGRCPVGQVELPNDQPGGVIIYYLKQVLFLVNALVGGIIILVLVIAGIQYITSAGDPSNVKSAKNRVMNAVIALVLYLMMFAILNFLVPGGIL